MTPYSISLVQMKNNSLNNNGFTYLMALMLVMVMGIMLSAIGQSWKNIIQRDREEELLFRGLQYKNAITRWYTQRPGQPPPTPLRDLKDLLEDPRSLTKYHYLRKLYTDPMTGKEWNPIKDPNKGISGVASTSQEKPLKVGGFPDDLQDFNEKQHYSDWLFVYLLSGPSPMAGSSPNQQQVPPATGSPWPPH